MANNTNVSHADSLNLSSEDICLSEVKLHPLPISNVKIILFMLIKI